MYDFIIYGIIGGIGLAFSLSLLGNFIVWKRMSYIGDSIAHSSILGVAIGTLTSLSHEIGIIFISFILSSSIVLIKKKLNIARDSLLVFNTQFALSLGFIIMSLLNTRNILYQFLFGSILSINIQDIIIIYTIGFLTLIYFIMSWQKLLLLTISEDLAVSENISIIRHEIAFIFVLSCIIAFSIKIIGALLIPSLTVIPSIIANSLSRSPFIAIIIAFIVGAFAVIFGILVSMYIDISSSALITLTLCCIFFINLLILNILKKI